MKINDALLTLVNTYAFGTTTIDITPDEIAITTTYPRAEFVETVTAVTEYDRRRMRDLAEELKRP